MAKRLFTISTLLDAYLGLNEHTVRRAISSGRLEAHQLLGGQSMIWISEEAAERWLTESRVEPEADRREPAGVAPCSDTNFDFAY